MPYVEFPMDLIVDVHWKKKPDDGGGPPPDEDAPGACGAWSTSLPLFARQPGLFSPQYFGLWALAAGTENGARVVIWLYVPHITFIGSEGNLTATEVADYLWFKPASWTITASSSPLDIDGFLIRVWRNQDPRAFHPCTTPSSGDVSGPPSGGSASVEIQPQTSTEQYPPIFMITGRGGANCSMWPAELHVQGNCAVETVGALPPQPTGFPVNKQVYEVIGPPLPGSYFYG